MTSQIQLNDTELAKKAILVVTGAGLDKCNGIYTVCGNSRNRPKWKNKATDAIILYWGGSCGWEMYEYYSGMCQYWPGKTSDDSYPWKLPNGAKWIVRPGNKKIEPAPNVIGKYIIGEKQEQQMFESFLSNNLRIPKKVAKLPWLYFEMTLE
eukprot:241524_1